MTPNGSSNVHRPSQMRLFMTHLWHWFIKTPLDLERVDPFRELIEEVAQESVFKINREGTIEYVNGFGANMLGCNMEDIIGQPISKLFPPEITKSRQAINALTLSERRFTSLFENAPIALWEEDYSLLQIHLDELRQSGVINFRDYFGAHPKDVANCVRMLQVINVNKKTLFSSYALFTNT